MTLITKKGKKLNPTNYKSEKLKPFGGKKNHLNWPFVVGGRKNVTWIDHPLVVKKTSLEVTPH
jgi:hypothetical protein